MIRRGGHDHERRKKPARRAGFTLLEALMAAGILLMVVVCVTEAITAGQQNAYEAHQRIAGTLAAEELLGRLVVKDYNDLPKWNGYTEAVGTMTDVSGQPMPASMKMIGRDVQVTTSLKDMTGIDVRVQGRDVRVRAFTADGRAVADLTHFVPEPQS